MTKVHENLEKKDIPVPSNVTAVSICQRTGKLASPGCHYAHTEYFVKGTVPSKYCNNSSGNYIDSEKITEPSPESDTESQEGEQTDEPKNNDTINIDSGNTPQKMQTPSSTAETPAKQNNGGDVITLD